MYGEFCVNSEMLIIHSAGDISIQVEENIIQVTFKTTGHYKSTMEMSEFRKAKIELFPNGNNKTS